VTRVDRLPQAHGIGGAQDLPISPSLAIVGAVAALVISFAVLALAWRTPRYDAATSGRPAPGWLSGVVDSTAFLWGARLFGLVLTAYTLWVAVWGKDLLTNPVFGMFYVLLWVGLVPASVVLGPVWRAISPFRTFNIAMAALARRDPGAGLFDYPSRLGYWPAALGLFSFVWLELVFPRADELGPVRLWIAVYCALMMLGVAIFGGRFTEHADPFEVYSTLVAKLSPWGRRDGQLVVRSPLANLDTTPARPGLVAVVAVLFGSTAFDSFRESSAWFSIAGNSSAPVPVNTLGLVGFCVGVALVLGVGSMATAVADGVRRPELPTLFAHSIIPIVVGYVVAHYLTYLVGTGQSTIILMSDPMSQGSNLFGTADWQVNYWLAKHPSLLASTKVGAVVLGHVLGVVAAHDRAVRILPLRHQLTGQLPLLVAMIGFTVGGLYLLFAS
jgi:hypothetical protein